ncbi:MAG: DinB family protein [Actinobacteria bacterium]|nr:DinB family protein [Actinomycetota bacterium]
MSEGYVCPECGLDYDTILPPDAVVALRSFPRRYRELLPERDDDAKPDGVIRRRPAPGVWSALEYTAHVADVLDDLADAIRRMTTEDQPTLGGFDPDARAGEARYNEQDREAVLGRLTDASEKAAAVVDAVPNDAWSRTATFPWGVRDALTMARNAVHEGSHHRRDVESVLARVVGR